ncbi:hypothetical protein PGB90_007978 [Kerria lacca]
MAKSVGCTGIVSTISKDDLDRWTDSVTNVLDSPRARRKFNEFLSSRSFDDAALTLQFWENCSKILSGVKQDETLKKNNHLDLNIISHTRLRSNFSALIDFAIENVNFDANELRVMRQALVSNNIPTIIKTIENAQTTSANLLLDEFQLFRDTLLKRVSTKCN